MDSQAEDRAYFKSLKINDVTCDFLIDNFIDKETFDDLNKETLRGDLPSAKDGHLIQIKRGIIEKEKAAQLLATVAPADKLVPTTALDNFNAIPAASSASKPPQSLAGLPTNQQAAAVPGTATSDLADFVSETHPKSSEKSADVEDNGASGQQAFTTKEGLQVLGNVPVLEHEDGRKGKKRKHDNKQWHPQEAAIDGRIGDKLSAEVVERRPKSTRKAAANEAGVSGAGCSQSLRQKKTTKTSGKKEGTLKINGSKPASKQDPQQATSRGDALADKADTKSPRHKDIHRLERSLPTDPKGTTATGYKTNAAASRSEAAKAMASRGGKKNKSTADEGCHSIYPSELFAAAIDPSRPGSLRSSGRTTAKKASNGCETSVSKQPHSKGSQSMGKLRSQASAVSYKALHDASVAVAVSMDAKSSNAFRKTAESNDHKSSVKSEAHASASFKASRSHTDRGGSTKPSLSAKKIKTTALLIQGREYRCVINNCRTTPRPSMVNADVSFYAAWRSPASFQETLDFVKRFNGADFKRKDTDTICSHHYKDSDYRSTDGSMFNCYLDRRAVPSLSHTIDRDDGEPDSGISIITEPISTMENKAVERLTASPKSSKASLQDSKRAKTELPSDSSSCSGTRMIPASKKVRSEKSVVKEELVSGAETCMMPAAIIKVKTEQSERKYGRAYTAAKGTHPELTKHYYKQTPRGSFLNRDVPCTVLGTREDLATVMGDVNDEVRSNHDGESDDSDDMNE